MPGRTRGGGHCRKRELLWKFVFRVKLCSSSGAEEPGQSLLGAGAVAVTQFVTQAGKSEGKTSIFRFS